MMTSKQVRAPAGCDAASRIARHPSLPLAQGCCRATARDVSSHSTRAIWTRPTPDRNEDWVKPSYVPKPVEPSFTPSRREEQPLYSPGLPEFKPAELPEQTKELPAGPKMPDRPRDPLPAGNPKKEAPPGEADKREAPPSEKK